MSPLGAFTLSPLGAFKLSPLGARGGTPRQGPWYFTVEGSGFRHADGYLDFTPLNGRHVISRIDTDPDVLHFVKPSSDGKVSGGTTVLPFPGGIIAEKFSVNWFAVHMIWLVYTHQGSRWAMQYDHYGAYGPVWASNYVYSDSLGNSKDGGLPPIGTTWVIDSPAVGGTVTVVG